MLRWVGAACAVIALVVPGVRAQSPEEPATSPSVVDTRPSAPPGVDVPRGAVERFFTACRENDYGRAAELLDLRKIPRAARAERGPLLARELEAVLERSVTLDLALLSDDADGDREDGLPPNRELLAIVETESGPVELLLERGTVGGAQVWRVTADTVARIPALYGELGYGPFADRLPAPLVSVRLFGVRLWQALGLVLLVGVAVSLAWLLARVATRVAAPLVTRAGLDARTTQHATGPLTLLLTVAIARAGLPFLSLALAPQRIVIGAGKALVIVACTWLFLRAIDVMSARAQRRFLQYRQLGAISMIPLGRRVLKITVALLAFVAALQNFGFNVTGLAAGLGIGGLAIALAAQKTVENLFGGVTLIADQPVRVGDYCRFGDAEGIVEDIGLRSTRIRTLDRTIVTVPNAQFSAMALENLSRRDRILVRQTLLLKNETGAVRVRQILESLRAMLAAQPKVEEESARARLVRISPQGTEIELFAYVLTTSVSEFIEHREQILLGALEAMGGAATTVK
jgi:MscS family membrane protein